LYHYRNGIIVGSKADRLHKERIVRMKILRLMVIGSVALALIVMGGFFASSTVEATTITLSDLSSDETDPSVLDAILDFSVSDSTLTLTVTNTTEDPNFYNINEVYFNATSNVMGLSPETPFPGGWSLSTNQSADGFGVFDFALTDGVGTDEAQIIPGETVTFKFTIVGTNSFSADDFTTERSTIPPGDRPAFAAAKFVQGPGDDSAYGAVPEPSTVLLLGAGLIGLALVGRLRFKGRVKG